MKTNLIKLLTIAVFTLTVFALMNLNTNTTTRVLAKDDDPAAVYKTKCAMCHSPKAEKAYDPAVAIEEQVNIILKGKKVMHKLIYLRRCGFRCPPYRQL